MEAELRGELQAVEAKLDMLEGKLRALQGALDVIGQGIATIIDGLCTWSPVSTVTEAQLRSQIVKDATLRTSERGT